MVSTKDFQHVVTHHYACSWVASDLTEHSNQWSVVHIFTALAVDLPQCFQNTFVMNLPAA